MKNSDLVKVVTVLIIFCSSCARKSIFSLSDSSDVNTALPDDYKTRSFFSKTAQIRSDINSFVGSIAYIYNDSNAEIVYLPSLLRIGPSPSSEPIKEGNLYEAKITNKWDFDLSTNLASTLIKASEKFSDEKAYELIIQDVTSTKVKQDSIKWDRVWEVAKKGKPAEVKCRCLILNSILSTVLYKEYKKIDNSTKAAVGDVFAVNGLTYNSENNRLTKDYRISFWCYDIDKAYEYTKSNNAFDNTDEKKAIAYLKVLASDGAVKNILTNNTINNLNTSTK